MRRLRYPCVPELALAFAAALLVLSVAAPVHAAPAGSRRQAPAASEPSGEVVVDINKAAAADLLAVPGIGKSLAQRIVDFREKNGPFGQVDDLLKVQGIGEKSLEKLRPYLTCGKPSR